jgi:hypothetical protein
VFDQTQLPRDTDTSWWVEVMLQRMKINGLVKMINSSKKLDTKYIEGYASRYKWAYRQDGFDISSSYEAWLLLCGDYFIDPFPWVSWYDIVLMSNIPLLKESISRSIKSGVRHSSYLAKIYANIDFDMFKPIVPVDVIQFKSDTISNIKSGDWFEIRKHIA